jgi:hypothetical protein
VMPRNQWIGLRQTKSGVNISYYNIYIYTICMKIDHIVSSLHWYIYIHMHTYIYACLYIYTYTCTITYCTYYLCVKGFSFKVGCCYLWLQGVVFSENQSLSSSMITVFLVLSSETIYIRFFLDQHKLLVKQDRAKI